MQDFVSPSEFASYLQVAELPPGADLTLEAAMQSVREYLQQTVSFGTTLELHDGRDLSTLRLRERPVRHVHSVKVDGNSVPFIARRAKLTRTNGVFPLGLANVAVTYDFGYDVLGDLSSDTSDSSADQTFNPVPADIRLATLSAARRALLSFGQDDAAATTTGETIGGYSHTDTLVDGTRTLTLSEVETGMLDPYVVRKVQ